VGVAALGAALLLLTAGGVAYATIPDAGGVIHGCYKNSNGALRVIDTDTGAHCSGAESALDWNQSGPGPAASTFTTTVSAGDVTLATLDNGITVTGICSAGSGNVQLEISVPAGSGNTLQLSGTTFNTSSSANSVPSTDINQLEANNDVSGFTTVGPRQTDLDVLARDSSGSNAFARIDVHGSGGPPCTFWGMIIPSA
jgi:hypothetical protein